jgi:hypothetical protein
VISKISSILLYNIEVTIRLNNNNLESQPNKYRNNLQKKSTSNIDIGSSLNKYLLKLVLDYEKTVEHKLNILILGSTHYDLGIALADYGHKITFLTWDIDDHKKLKASIDKSKLYNQISNQIINLKTIESLTETKYDILFCLIPMYRMLTDLNFIKQKVFFEYILKNINTALWLIPRNDERNPLDIYLQSQKDLDFYINYDYVFELARVKIAFNSVEYPILYTSKTILLINSRFYKNDFGRSIRNAGSIFSRVYLIKNKLYKVSLLNSDGYSTVSREFKFLSNLRLIDKIKLRIPIKVVLNKGLVFDSLQRKNINGIGLHEIKTISDSDKILKEFIKLCRKFSKAKIYHNDIRPWNILWNGKKCVFIDFENSSRYDQDVSNFPQILLFFAIANYIKKSDRIKIWGIEDIIQQNSEYLYSNEARKLFYNSWEKISIVSINELLAIDYCDVKTGFKQLIQLLESY